MNGGKKVPQCNSVAIQVFHIIIQSRLVLCPVAFYHNEYIGATSAASTFVQLEQYGAGCIQIRSYQISNRN